MKHLEESHKQMEDDLDIEAELEAELAAQEELMANMEEDDGDGDNDTETSPKYVRLAKVSSLPDNFIYTYFEDKTK